jgi:hypothetical protein
VINSQVILGALLIIAAVLAVLFTVHVGQGL